MSDERKNPKANDLGISQQETDAKTADQSMSEKELAKVNGGWGDIKGGSTDDKHKDW